jgi:hypothetical protein
MPHTLSIDVMLLLLGTDSGTILHQIIAPRQLTHSLVSSKGLQLLLNELSDGLLNCWGQAAAIIFFMVVLRITATGQPAPLAAAGKASNFVNMLRRVCTMGVLGSSAEAEILSDARVCFLR